MPSLKKNWENLIKYASKNPKNRKEAINSACGFISILSLSEDKKLSKEDLEKVAGGKWEDPLINHYPKRDH